jgi:fumarate reductase flavoprotein subunit
VDLVVVGSGVAGISTTVEASIQGLKVILVEQNGLLGGSSVRAGYLIGAGTKIQKDAGINLNPEEWARARASANAPNDPLYDAATALKWTSTYGQNIDWAQNLGVQFGPVVQEIQHYGGNGERLGGFLIAGLQAQLDKRGVDYRVNTKATDIIMQDGKAVGVKVSVPNGASYNIYGNVVLATGGYFGSPEMVAKYDPQFAGSPTDVSIGADGSGMRMAEKAGGILIEMGRNNYHGLATYYNNCSRSLTLPAGNGAIAVNKDGSRFINEAGDYTALTMAVVAQKDVWCIFDKEMMDLEVTQGDHGLSNIKEMYETANTPEELAAKLGINPQGVKETIEKYRRYVANRRDEDFGKAPVSMRTRFVTPPYYGVKALVELHTNYGGVKVDTNSRVLTAQNAPIQGLYAVGETAASLIRGSATLSASLAQGRLVAQYIKANK